MDRRDLHRTGRRRKVPAMINMQSITMREISLPLRERFQISSGGVLDRRILLLELIDVDGTVGWSECVAGEQPYYYPDTIDTSWIVIRDYLAPKVLGTTLKGPQDAAALLAYGVRGNLMPRGAVEMGLWEVAAQQQGIPLAQLLGGTREKIGTGISLGLQDSPEALVAKARTSYEEGYCKIKIKIKPGADIEYVRAVRDELGPDAPLMVDANNAYTLDDIEHLLPLDDMNLIMIEQPLAWDDVLRHAKLQERFKTPICLDESITGVDRVEDMIANRSGRIVNIKPGRVAGHGPAKAIHDLCQKHDIPVWCGGMLESGVGRGHNVALASLPNFTLPGDVSPSKRYWEQDIVTPEWTMDKNGMVTVPLDKPGIGVTVDRNRIDNLTVRSETIK
jgi:O-succinylbenzoate synthase